MLDHVSISVPDAAAAEAFYDAVIAALGHPRVSPLRYGIRNTAAADGHTYLRVVEGPAPAGGHLALRAPDRAAVDAFHAAALAHGGRDDGPPGLRPHYDEAYYAAFVLDPWGNRLEAVCHRTAPGRVLAQLHAAQGAFYAGGGDAALREVLTEDVEWHVPGENAIAGDYAGLEEVLAYMARRRDLADRSFRLHPGELLSAGGEHVAVLTDGTATIGGEERRWSTVGLYRLRGERIAACWLLPLDARAFDAIWATGGARPGRGGTAAPGPGPGTPP